MGQRGPFQTFSQIPFQTQDHEGKMITFFSLFLSVFFLQLEKDDINVTHL